MTATDDLYLESVALSSAMLDLLQNLANSTTSDDPEVRSLAQRAFKAGNEAIKDWERRARLDAPLTVDYLHAALKPRAYAIRDAWRAVQTAKREDERRREAEAAARARAGESRLAVPPKPGANRRPQFGATGF